MNRQIRRLGIVLMALFGALFVQLNYVQVVEAHKLANDPRNGRIATRDFSRERGSIESADGAVLATSVPADDAFQILARRSQQTNVKLRDLAAQFVKEAAASPLVDATRIDDILATVHQRACS